MKYIIFLVISFALFSLQQEKSYPIIDGCHNTRDKMVEYIQEQKFIPSGYLSLNEFKAIYKSNYITFFDKFYKGKGKRLFKLMNNKNGGEIMEGKNIEVTCTFKGCKEFNEFYLTFFNDKKSPITIAEGIKTEDDKEKDIQTPLSKFYNLMTNPENVEAIFFILDVNKDSKIGRDEFLGECESKKEMCARGADTIDTILKPKFNGLENITRKDFVANGEGISTEYLFKQFRYIEDFFYGMDVDRNEYLDNTEGKTNCTSSERLKPIAPEFLPQCNVLSIFFTESMAILSENTGKFNLNTLNKEKTDKFTKGFEEYVTKFDLKTLADVIFNMLDTGDDIVQRGEYEISCWSPAPISQKSIYKLWKEMRNYFE